MKTTLVVALAVFFFYIFAVSTLSMAKCSRISDEQIKEKIIQESISSYSRDWPCAYHSVRHGRQCGKRSAWNRGGGYRLFVTTMAWTKKGMNGKWK